MNNFIQSQTDTPATEKADTNTEDVKSKTNPIPKQLESLTTTIFQSLFAPINPQQSSLNSIKRVMLLDRLPSKSSSTNPDSTSAEAESHEFVLQLRHYAIKSSTPKSALPKPLRKLESAEKLSHKSSRSLPNLSKFDDVADYLLDPNAANSFTSASESEPDTDAEVEVLAPESRKVLGKEERQRMRDAQRARIAAATENPDGGADGPARPERRVRTEKKAIKLQELGPRMTLRLTKVEEGLCGGKIMWHEYISKSAKEAKQQEKTWEQRRAEKEERRRIQKENVEAKKALKTSQRGKPRKDGDEADEDEEMADGGAEDDDQMWSDDDDDEWDGAHDGEGGDKYAPDPMDQDDDEDEDEEDEE